MGTYSAIVSIANSDSDENPYTFAISGTATAVAMPEIDVRQGTTLVIMNSTYDMGGMTVGAVTPVDIVFTISNIGSAALNLTAGPPRISLAGDGEFTLFSDASTPVASMGSENFTLRFTASDVLTKTATVTIANDDADENPYVFGVTAIGTSPDMNLKQGVTIIASGVGSFDFGEVSLTYSKQLDFTIENTSGSSALFLTGSPMVTLVGSPQFTVVQQPPSSSIGPGQTEKFSIRYTPTGYRGGPGDCHHTEQ